MTDPAPPARSLLDIVLEQTQAGEHNVVVFRIHDNDFAELAEGEQLLREATT